MSFLASMPAVYLPHPPLPVLWWFVGFLITFTSMIWRPRSAKSRRTCWAACRKRDAKVVTTGGSRRQKITSVRRFRGSKVSDTVEMVFQKRAIAAIAAKRRQSDGNLTTDGRARRPALQAGGVMLNKYPQKYTDFRRCG